MPTPLDMIRSLGDKAVQGSPHARALGLQFVSADLGRAVLKAPYKDELIGDLDSRVIAGGVITALLDHCCGQSVWTCLEGFTSIATLDLRIDYMRAAEPGLDVYGEAHCYKLTRSMAFVRATAYEHTADDPVATAQAAFMLDSNAGRKAGANLKPSRSEEGAE